MMTLCAEKIFYTSYTNFCQNGQIKKYISRREKNGLFSLWLEWDQPKNLLIHSKSLLGHHFMKSPEGSRRDWTWDSPELRESKDSRRPCPWDQSDKHMPMGNSSRRDLWCFYFFTTVTMKSLLVLYGSTDTTWRQHMPVATPALNLLFIHLKGGEQYPASRSVPVQAHMFCHVPCATMFCNLTQRTLHNPDGRCILSKRGAPDAILGAFLAVIPEK